MKALLFITLFFIPLFYAQQYQTEFDNNDDVLVPRSIAARYLFGLPVRRYSNPIPFDSSSLSSDDSIPQQRGKRIYWENLAFHASDFNQKAKKL